MIDAVIAGVFCGVIDDVTSPLDADAVVVRFSFDVVPGERLHCRHCDLERGTYRDVCDGQTEIRCWGCHRVLRRLGTEKHLVFEAFRSLCPPQGEAPYPPSWGHLI